MPDGVDTSSLTNIHFPQRIQLIKTLRLVSFLINDIILFISALVIIIWISPFIQIQARLFQSLSIQPFSSILFIILSIPLFFGAKRHLNRIDDENKETGSWWNTSFPIFFASLAAVLGLMRFMHLNFIGSLMSLSPLSALCFFILGLSLIPPFTRIPHRFHITQFLLFIVSGLSVYVILESLYQAVSHVMIQQPLLLPLTLALTFAFFCFGVLLRWSNRGFFGNFTLDSTGSIFAFRIFLINLIGAPIIAFVVLLSAPKTAYSLSELISLIVIFFTIVSSLLIWINVKFLYKYELEHLLMRESLKSHNIDLTTEKEKLEEKMVQIEKEKQRYKEDLDVQSSWRTVIDNSE